MPMHGLCRRSIIALVTGQPAKQPFSLGESGLATRDYIARTLQAVWNSMTEGGSISSQKQSIAIERHSIHD